MERGWRMADSESDYKVGPGRPPLHTRFKKGQSGNPGAPGQEPAGAARRCAERDGRRDDRRTAPQAHQARGDRHPDGRKSASADLRATKMLLDMMKDVEHKAGDPAPPPEPPAGWPRRTRRWCSDSWRGCAGRSCTRSKSEDSRATRIALSAIP